MSKKSNFDHVTETEMDRELTINQGNILISKLDKSHLKILAKLYHFMI